MSVSAVLIVLNEEKNIKACLETLSFADEIVVVDGGSTDRTVELARPLTKKIVQRKLDDFSSQKNFAVEQASSEWIFSIDADERVSRELAGEILEKTTKADGAAAYAVKRKTKLFGRVFKYSGLQDDKPVRFFKKGAAHFEQPVHEKLIVRGRTGLLKEPLRHESFQTFAEYLSRLQFYTSLEKDAASNSTVDFFIRPLRIFLWMYVVKQGFRDGVEGLIYCALSGYYKFIWLAKSWEKARTKSDG